MKIAVDEKRFGYYYQPAEKRVYIFDKENNRMVRSFGEEVSFIHQYKRNNKVLFAVCVNEESRVYLTAFNTYGIEDPLFESKVVALESGCYEDVYLGNDCFLLNTNQILSLSREEICGSYDKITMNEETDELLGEDCVLVSKILEDYQADIIEEIVYGLDLKSFKVTTPIYSKMQNRFIKKYSKRDVAASKTKYPDYSNLKVKNYITPDSLAEETIRYEILRPFVIVGQQLAESVMLDKNGNIKEDFIKRLGDKNGNSKKNN